MVIDNRNNKNKLLRKNPFANRYFFLFGAVIIAGSVYMIRDILSYNRIGMNVLIPIVLLGVGLFSMGAAIIGFIVQKKHKYIYSQITYIETCQKTAFLSRTIGDYISNYDEMMSCIETFKTVSSPYTKYMEIDPDKEKGDFQWHLRDAVAKEAADDMSLIKKTYSNSLEHKRKVYMEFVDSVRNASDRFEGNETWDFVETQVNKVYRASGITIPAHTDIFQRRTFKMIEDGTKANTIIEDIDGMDGHEFEYWCADILRSNGFHNVKVTPGSGDQGIDITAVKDSVKYAVQCKNYTGQLGNTSVQEAHAGKAFYSCHVGVVMTNSTFTTGAIALAEKTGVLLWDRDTLRIMMLSGTEG